MEKYSAESKKRMAKSKGLHTRLFTDKVGVIVMRYFSIARVWSKVLVRMYNNNCVRLSLLLNKFRQVMQISYQAVSILQV